MRELRKYYRNHPWFRYVAIFLVCGLVLFLRRPDALTNPQFWAEDGRFWFADAYNSGPFRSIFEPYAGTLQLGMRLLGALSQILPFTIVPLFFTLCAIVIKIIPVIILFSRSFTTIISNSRAKIAIGIFYIAIPTGEEVHANLTNINWHLALIAFMLILLPMPTSFLKRFFFYVIAVISGLTGPFTFFLFIVSAIHFLKHRSKHLLILAIIFLITTFVQLSFLLFSNANRETGELGANITTLSEIIGFRIGASTVIGQENIASIFRPPSGIYILFGAGAIAIVIYAFMKGTYYLRLFILFSLLMLSSSLIKPIASTDYPQWYALLIGAGSRYFFVPILCFFLCVLSISEIRSKTFFTLFVSHSAKVLVFASFVVAIPTEFNYPPRDDYKFQESAKMLDKAPSKTNLCLPIPPAWDMCLQKK